MNATQPLAEQLAECERWCAEREEKECVPIAERGLRVLPQHHAELARPWPGQVPTASGWLLRSDALGPGNWFLLGLLFVAGTLQVFVTALRIVERSDHPLLYGALLVLPAAAAVAYLPLRLLLRSHEIDCTDDMLVVRRRVFGRLDREWRLPVTGPVSVSLARRGAGRRNQTRLAVCVVPVASKSNWAPT